MYTVAVNRAFIARHFLFGGDWGAENHPHAHAYRVEIRLSGERLNDHGFLVDIVDVETILNELTDYFRDALLNDLAEFRGLNPSLEHFARIFATRFAQQLRAPEVRELSVRLWENDSAWAGYRISPVKSEEVG